MASDLILVHPADREIYAARFVPHRSLSRRHFRVLIVLFCGIGLIGSVPFLIFGAWPVAGFMGLDVVALFIAFHVNFRAARAYEDISLSPVELRLAKVSAGGRRREFRFHPAWVKLRREDHEEFGTRRLALLSRGTTVEIAGFLGADEKAQVALDLDTALTEARRGPRFERQNGEA